LSFIRAVVVPRAGRPRPGPPRTVSCAGGRPVCCTSRERYSCSGTASARTRVRICRCALGRLLFAGAASVGSIPRTAPSDSLALTACPHPSCGDVGEGLFTAASVLRSSLLLFGRPRWRSLSLLLQRSPASRLELVIPRAPWCGGCSYPRERNWSPVCKGIYWVFVGAKCNRFKDLDICRRPGEPPRVLPMSKPV
jgi:hypothetical protein